MLQARTPPAQGLALLPPPLLLARTAPCMLLLMQMIQQQ
jgi:hypothetical protein